jgi:hypothetical protein
MHHFGSVQLQRFLVWHGMALGHGPIFLSGASGVSSSRLVVFWNTISRRVANCSRFANVWQVELCRAGP